MPGACRAVKAQGCGQFLNKAWLIHRPMAIPELVVEPCRGIPGWRAQAFGGRKSLSQKDFEHLSTEKCLLYYSYQLKIFNYCC